MIRLSSKLVREAFDEMCRAMETEETILNQGTVEYAVFKVNNQDNIFAQAAVAMYEIAKGHAFSDGNKRAAYIVASYILGQRGYKIKANPHSCTKLLKKIAQNRESLNEVREWMRKHTIKS